MPDMAGPLAADRRVAWIVGVACVGGMVLIASGLSYSYWQAHGPQRHRAAPSKSAPAPKQAALRPKAAPQKPAAEPETGDASWYDFAGEATANGETMDEDALTAAHPSLPFGTKVEVENVANGKTVVVRVNDRGPHVGGRIIDVSEAAAEELDMIEDGVAEVEITPVRNAEGGSAE